MTTVKKVLTQGKVCSDNHYMTNTPDPFVHPGDRIRPDAVVALDIRGTDGINAGLRVRAELTRDELADLVDALTARLEAVDGR